MKALENFIYNNPTKIFFGVGKLGELHTEPLPGKRALLLTSKGNSSKRNGSLSKTIEELKKVSVEYVHVANVEENPLKEQCEEAANICKAKECDFIIALGGGAVLDAAVPISILATNDGDLWDYVDGGSGKGQTALNRPLPIVTIATTSGTGSEINECGVISRMDTHEKVGMSDRRCKPVLAIIDPTYMVTVPPRYTAYQGFDAFFHHAEAMISNRLNLMSEMIALEGIREIYHYLPIAVRDGRDIEARTHIAYAATLSGMTMQLTRITAQHAMEHAMSAYHRGLPHGAGLILISKAFAQFFIDRHVADDRFIKMTRVMGYPNTMDPQDYIKGLEQLKKACDVAGIKMSDYGIVKDESAMLAVAARKMQGGLYSSCPYDLTDYDVEKIFERSF